jgi:outer membrane receptor protein involved in Fe transport
MRLKIIVSLLLITFISAQKPDPSKMLKIGVLQGTVIDSVTTQPLQYASVSLISQRTDEIITGGITDEDGRIYITKIPFGMYRVSIEYIGYKREDKGPIKFNPRENTVNVNLGNIELSPSTLSFSKVEVSGERPLFVQTMDKKIFNVEQNTITSGGSALDVLRQVPGVDVDNDGNVSLRGSANVNFLIDGKPAIMAGGDAVTLLENIPADNISDVEVVTNPSAKYDPEGMAGIINVVLKENRFAGISGNVKSGGNTLSSYNGSGQLNYRNEKVNIFSNIGIRHDVRGGDGETYRETDFTDYTNILDQEIDSERGGDNIFIKSGIEYFPNLKNSFGISATYSDGNRIHDQIVITNEIDDQVLKYERINDGNRDSKKYDIAATYNRKFENSKQTLSTILQVSNSNNINEDFNYTSPYSGYEDLVDPDTEKTTTDNEYNTTDLQIDYVHPFGENAKLEVGYKGTQRSIDNLFNTFEQSNDEEFYIDEERSNNFIYSEDIHAAYGVFTTQKGIFGLQLGLRGENVETVSELKDTNEKIENPYTSFYPSFSASAGQQQLFQVQVSYSRRINRPSYRRLNPAIHALDQYNIRVGNPFLKPEYIDVAEINFSKFTRGMSISFGGYYRHITDKISYYKYVNDDGVSITTHENFDTQDTYGLELIASGSLGKKFRIMLNGNLFADEVNASNVFDDYNKTSTGFMSRVTGTWNISPTMEIMVMGFYRSPRDIPIGRMDSMAFTSVSAKKKVLNDKLSISLKVNDVLNTMGFGYETYGENYYQESTRKWNSQSVGIQLEYKFGSMEDKSSFSRKRNGQNGNSDGMGEYEIE